LRLDAAYAGRFDILRRGYQFFRELQADAPADFYFTSIAADNERARRLLERGLPSMPRYEFIGEFVTVLLRSARRSPARAKSRTEVPSQLVAYRAHLDTATIQSVGLGQPRPTHARKVGRGCPARRNRSECHNVTLLISTNITPVINSLQAGPR